MRHAHRKLKNQSTLENLKREDRNNDALKLAALESRHRAHLAKLETRLAQAPDNTNSSTVYPMARPLISNQQYPLMRLGTFSRPSAWPKYLHQSYPTARDQEQLGTHSSCH